VGSPQYPEAIQLNNMKLYISLESPYLWVTVGAKGQIRESGSIENLDEYRVPKSVEQVVGVAPGEIIACHTVHIPGKKRRYAESALGFALEESLSDDIENLHFKLLSWDANGTANAAVISRQQLTDWIDKFRFNGINLDAVVADYFLLPQHPKGEVTISGPKDDRVFIRTDKFSGLTLDASGFEYWWQTRGEKSGSCSVTDLALAKKLRREFHEAGNPTNDPSAHNRISAISHWDIGSDFREWFAKMPFRDELSSYNLLEGLFAPGHTSKSANILKIAASVAVLGVVLHTGTMIYENQVLESRKAELAVNMRSLFSSYFPDEPYLDRPTSQVTNLIANARKGMSGDSLFQKLLSATSQIAPGNGATVDEINYRDETMIVVCRVRDLSSLDTIIQAFNELQGIRAELLSSGARDGVVTGRFRVTGRG
jgi:general secretion pathway protein L